MKCRYEYNQNGQVPKLATCASITSIEKSAMNVGKTLYLLSEGGRHKDIKVSRGGNMVPYSPILGSVCLAVGELNLSLVKPVKQKKKRTFLILIYVRPAEAEAVNQGELYYAVIILCPKQKVGRVVSIMKIENSFGEVLLIV